MAETDLKKIPFFQKLNLKAITPVNDSSNVFRNHLLVLPNHNANLMEKNNSIKTGYENFCIKKGSLKLLPFKDFDFIGKHVVCQKCCQMFVSKMSYKAHIGTSLCVKTYDGPNLIYFKYKKRTYREFWKKNGKKSKEDIHDPEILNTLQTHNKVYSDITDQQNKIIEKSMNNLQKNNDEPYVKRSRGRPRKNIVNQNVVPKKRGRPKKLNAVTFDKLSQNDNSSSSNQEINESEESKKLNNCIFDYRFNNNINEDSKLKLLSSKFKNLSEKFWKLFKNDCGQQDTDNNEYQYFNKYQTQNNEEKQCDLAAEKKEILLIIGELEDDFKFLSKQFQDKKKYPFNDELKLILTKSNEMRNEIEQSIQIKTHMKESISNKGKENIKHILKKNENVTETEINYLDFDKNEKCKKIYLNNSITSPTTNTKMNDGCKFINCSNVENIEKESTSCVNFDDNIKITTPNEAPNNIKTNNNHLNDLGLNYIYDPTLNCKICYKNFTSIAEWKLHHSEHSVNLNKTFLCTICGLKFKIYNNFKKHSNAHEKTEQKIAHNKKNFKYLECKICNRRYYYLRSYYAHIKTHDDENQFF